MARAMKVWLAALPVAAAMLMPAAASACPCHEFCGRVVAHGSSLYGVPWRIKAATRPEGATGRSTAEISFSVHACGEYSEAGYSMGLPIPLADHLFFRADAGADIDAYPEGDLSGLTSRGIVELEVRMSDGETLIVHPHLAPHRLWRVLPWLRGLRFFDAFFAAGVKPLEVIAFDRAGHAVASSKSKLGQFVAR
jgi:hypothetical protein